MMLRGAVQRQIAGVTSVLAKSTTTTTTTLLYGQHHYHWASFSSSSASLSLLVNNNRHQSASKQHKPSLLSGYNYDYHNHHQAMISRSFAGKSKKDYNELYEDKVLFSDLENDNDDNESSSSSTFKNYPPLKPGEFPPYVKSWRAEKKYIYMGKAYPLKEYLKHELKLGRRIRLHYTRGFDQITLEELKERIDFIREKLFAGETVTEKQWKTFFWGGLGFTLHHKNEESIMNKIQYLLDHVYRGDTEVVKTVLLKYPAILKCGFETQLKPKIEYLKNQVFGPERQELFKEQLTVFPQILLGSYHLQKYIQPEIEDLRQAGHDPALHLPSLQHVGPPSGRRLDYSDEEGDEGNVDKNALNNLEEIRKKQSNKKSNLQFFKY